MLESILDSGDSRIESTLVVGGKQLSHAAAQIFSFPHGQGDFLAIDQRDGVRAVVALPDLVEVHELAVVDPHKLAVIDQALHILQVLGHHQTTPVRFVNASITAAGFYVKDF